MGISLRKVVIVLAILTIAMTGATVYAYTLPEQMASAYPGNYIAFHEVNLTMPHEYHVLTDPDRHTLEAIENPDTLIHVGDGDADPSWWDQPYVGSSIRYVEFQGKYYMVSITHVTSQLITEPSLQDFIPLGFLGLGVCWVAVAYKHRRNKRSVEE